MSEPSRDYDTLGLVVLVLSVVAALLLVPDLELGRLVEPVFSAVLGTGLFLALIVALRGRGLRGSKIERIAFAVFLGGMPFVYINSRLLSGGTSEELYVELAGALVFVPLAVMGARRSPWLLVGGIAAHGLLWDAWHHGRSSFMPDWYADACLIIDVGVSIYLATQVRAFQATQATRS